MQAQFDIRALGSAQDWADLLNLISNAPPGPTTALVELYKSIGATGCIIEAPYIDRDFSAAYSAFYASLFAPHSKYCRRIHFFRNDLQQVVTAPDAEAKAVTLASLSPDYLGFLVLRPLKHAPIGTAVVSQSHAINASTEITVRSRYSVHLLGAELRVEGVPLTQQDTRIGACAQASIWIVGRHFHNRHGGPWFSMPAISELALNPTDGAISTSLPQGSAFLRLDNMVRALRSMDRCPVVYAPNGQQGARPTWGRPKPHEIVNRYVDSGIPVIVGLMPKGPDVIGHAVVAVGREAKSQVDLASLPSKPTAAESIAAFLVNDDQRGMFRPLPIEAAQLAGPNAATTWSLNQDCMYLIVPLPAKVYLPAEVADVLARDLTKQIEAARPNLPPTSASPDPAHLAALASDGAVSRTYLTFGWKYQARAIRNELSADFKRQIAEMVFPRYVWVTEFSMPAVAFDQTPCARKVIGHVVIDATGSQFWESVLVAEVPGYAVTLSANGGYNATPTNRDQPYYAKTRGRMDFEQCRQATP